MSDQPEALFLADVLAHHPQSGAYHRAAVDCLRRQHAEIETLKAECDALRAKVELEQMRLAVCGVVAMANTPESAAKDRDIAPEYRSASCDDVAKAVDREMALRAECDALREIVADFPPIEAELGEVSDRAFRAEAERDALRAQLPDGMKDCTITFSQCERGHGHLSATNWVQHPCLACECDALRAALEGLLARDQRNTCQHESTHRGGVIWEICDGCGMMWADDEGGKPEWVDPPEWDAARAAITKAGGNDE